jgi:ADP-ribosylglycohydrolase
MDKQIKDRIYGTILGAACANSMGGSCIGLNRKDIVASIGSYGLRDLSPGLSRSFLPNHKPGEFLADTHLASVVAQSLIAKKGQFDEADLKQRFEHLLEDNDFLTSAPGAPCLAALRRMADGEAPADDGSPEALHDSGAVRAYIVGCLPNAKNIVDIAVKQAQLTHTDTRVQAAAAVLAHSVSSFVTGERLDSESEVRKYVSTELDIANKIDERFAEAWDDIAPDLDYMNPAFELPYSLINIESQVTEAVPTAVGIFLIFRHDLTEAIAQAACAGGDTDTIACVVGALSGAYHGASAIPERWLSKLQGRQQLEKIAEDMAAMW